MDGVGRFLRSILPIRVSLETRPDNLLSHSSLGDRTPRKELSSFRYLLADSCTVSEEMSSRYSPVLVADKLVFVGLSLHSLNDLDRFLRNRFFL